MTVFALTVFIIYICTREAYRQLDVAHEVNAALLSFSDKDNDDDTITNKCILTSGPAHDALSALTGDDHDRLWCDAEDGSCAVWSGGKVIDARCVLSSKRLHRTS